MNFGQSSQNAGAVGLTASPSTENSQQQKRSLSEVAQSESVQKKLKIVKNEQSESDGTTEGHHCHVSVGIKRRDGSNSDVVSPVNLTQRRSGRDTSSVRPKGKRLAHLNTSRMRSSDAALITDESSAGPSAASTFVIQRALCSNTYDTAMQQLDDRCPTIHSEDELRRAPQGATRDEDENEDGEDEAQDENEDEGEDTGEDSRTSPFSSLDPSVPPVHRLDEIFDIIGAKLQKKRFATACAPIDGQGLRVVTMCSGTESPLIAMGLLNDALTRSGSAGFPVNHLASAEIEPFKQAYIHRNFEPSILFRDVTEFIENEEQAHTAFGGLAAQPQDVHLLIAGSSCIDYSSLNSNKKKFGEHGQSYMTFEGVAAYVKRCRPAVVILENVRGAPWEKIRDYYDDMGYFGIVMYLDTKDFYIPQTRKRGYMVAFDKARAAEIKLDLIEATKALYSSVELLMQRASSPYTEFIYGDDDPELKLAMKDFSETGNLHSVDWAACRVRYAGYRIQYELGTRRPLTYWKGGGKSQFMDYCYMNWAKMQRERILDTLDINYLAYMAMRDYDMTYKCRFVELSQNVDRDQDSRHWGIVSCITPSGMPWDTRRGAPVVGKEVLALQGIPVENLSLNQETSRQLQDLAGNAMSTTVIGSVIFGAMIASCVNVVDCNDDESAEVTSMFQDFSSGDSCPVESSGAAFQMSPEQFDELTADQHMKRLESWSGQGKIANTLKMKALAASTSLLCKCDSIASAPIETAYQCRLCGHTACISCAGNPPHQYQHIPSHVLDSRKHPKDFVNYAMENLSPSLKLQLSEGAELIWDEILNKARNRYDHAIEPDILRPKALKPEDHRRYKQAVLAVFGRPFYFDAVKQESNWRIVYQSVSARLELQFLTHGHCDTDAVRCKWLLYAKPLCDELPLTIVRDLLEHPIAKMVPYDHDVMTGEWQIWDPSMPCAYLDIQGFGQPLPAWEQKLGLQTTLFHDTKVFEYLRIRPSKVMDNMNLLDAQVIESVCGDYQWLSNCGSACGSLHQQISSDSGQRSQKYFFLDPKPLQDAYLDRMVFADTHKRLPHDMTRSITAALPKAWRVYCSNFDSETLTAESVPCRLIDRWCHTDTISFASATVHHDLTPWIPEKIVGPEPNLSCTSTTPILLVKLPTDDIPQSQWSNGKQYSINLVDKPGALKSFQWLLKSFHRGFDGVGGQIDLTGPASSCPVCAPTPPLLEWHHTINRTGKKFVVKPFENSEAATTHEKSLLSRPELITATVHAHKDFAWLTVNLNLTSAIHRLGQRANLTAGNGIVDWQLFPSDSMDANPSFPSLKLPVKTADDIVWPTGDEKYAHIPNATKPTGFRRDLWQTQRRALAWVLKMERGTEWYEWDAEICNAPALNLQLQVELMAQISVRGGIIADEVGAGKTTTSLALIVRSIEESAPNENLLPSGSVTKISSRATLILVPQNIIGQWQDEIIACLGKAWFSKHVVVINFKNYKSLDIELLRSAHIVLAPWNIFDQAEYWQDFAKVCCAPNVPSRGGRAFKQWLDEATGDLDNIVQSCHGHLDMDTFKAHRTQLKALKKQKYTRFEVFRGKNITPDKEQKMHLQAKATELKKHEPAFFPGKIEDDSDRKDIDKDFETLYAWKDNRSIPVLLHFFTFKRIIVDEFTYPDARTLLAIQKLAATHHWMLSGTPPLANAESVNCMAKLIGTKVSCEGETNMCFSFKDARTVDVSEKTYAEEFREQLEKRVPAWYRKRYQRCEEFTDTFIRQNKAQLATVEQSTQYIVIPQTALEACVYNKCLQRIKGQPLRFNCKTADADNLSDEDFLKKTLERAATPEEALLSCQASLIHRYSANSDEEAISKFVTGLEQKINESVDDIVKCLQEIYWYWQEGQAKIDTAKTNPYFSTYLSCVLHCTFGDPCASDILSRATAYARSNPAMPQIMRSTKKMEEFNSQASHTMIERRNEMQTRTTDLNDKSIALVEQIQQWRLVQGVQRIMTDQSNLHCNVCAKQDLVINLTLLGQCGHLVCRSCLAKKSLSDTTDIGGCPQDGCSASVKDCQIFAKIYTVNDQSPTPRYGTKLEAVAHAILAVDQKDCVLVFIQFDAHRDQLCRLLKDKNVPHLDGTKRANAVISKFQKQSVPTSKVLILRIDSEDSAGWNLQIANHVMFVSPFLTKTQYDYDATMTQAIGRAFRFGQKKDVKVYHFITSGTLDVNVIQARTHKKLIKKGDGKYDLADYGSELARQQNDLSGPSLAPDSVAVIESGDLVIDDA